MISVMALRAVLLAALAGVQALSVVSAGDRTAVLIEVDGPVTFDHSRLTSPPRIVVDVRGADFRLPAGRFLDINRGGVLALRSSQFEPGVVRVVVDLAEAVDYEIERAGNVIRVTFPNPAGPFEAWSSAEAAPAPAPVPARTPMLGEPLPETPRPADRPGAPVPVTRPAAAQPEPQPQQPPIWVEFRNTPIVDVLGVFADFSGRSIVPGQGVGTQVITASIQGQPWDEAMRAILDGQGLSAREAPSGIIMVATLESLRQREEQEEIVHRSFNLRYVNADSIAPSVRQLLQHGEGTMGSVTSIKATNTLIVSARESVIDRISQTIPDLDRRTPQITIAARILFVNRTQIEALGIRYEIKDSRGTMLNQLTGGVLDSDGDGIFDTPVPIGEQVVNFAGNTIAAVGNATERIARPTFEVVSTLVLGRHSLIAWIEAVQRMELSEVQAEPVVTVLENRTARVQVGERTPIRVVDPGAATAQGPQAQVQTEQTGIILEVTPRVVGVGLVGLNLHAERSLVISASADQGFRFGTQETRTEIILESGQTAVISGLTITDYRESRSGIPILMNLPLLGALFRTTIQEEVKQDLLIMVTPYIEDDGGV